MNSSSKIVNLNELLAWVLAARYSNKNIVFTNGCFDILHVGHVKLLEEARSLADHLIVGINTDKSVKKLNKGPQRPINKEDDRALLIASLECVDKVILFSEKTPYNLIVNIMPDILVKGGDYNIVDVIGYKTSLVKILPFHNGYSTTSLIDKIQRDYEKTR
jgi:rfaE bifunctional protein nucleotidyltransferase chain/domain